MSGIVVHLTRVDDVVAPDLLYPNSMLDEIDSVVQLVVSELCERVNQDNGESIM